eukprot:7914718-Alexandrium_andersonii.AAC.1
MSAIGRIASGGEGSLTTHRAAKAVLTSQAGGGHQLMWLAQVRAFSGTWGLLDEGRRILEEANTGHTVEQ